MNEFIEPEETDDLLNDNHFKNILEETRKWAKFLAIVGFIGIGLMVLLALGLIVGAGFLGNMTDNMSGAASGSTMGIIYLVLALIYYFPVKYLYDFSSHLNQSLDSGDGQMFKEAHSKLKSLFKFMGIFTIITISIYILAIIAVLVMTL